MATVSVDHIFQLPVDLVWSILGDFGQTGKWSGRPDEACIQEGDGIGALRTLTTRDGRTIVDRLEAQTSYSYTYSIVSAPLPFKTYVATMTVEPIDAVSTRFRWTGEFEPEGISDAEAIELTRGMYAMGIGLMRDTFDKRSA